jgi:hypothetical protein
MNKTAKKYLEVCILNEVEKATNIYFELEGVFY